jgi:3-deoxy-D-manno-octulosonic-acid transferase
MPSRADWRTRGAAFAVLYLALAPVALGFLAYRLLGRRRALVHLRQKFSGDGPQLTPHCILLHGVSLGEVTLLRKLVPELERLSRSRCLLSTTTETGAQGLERHFPGHQRTFLPVDLPWAVNRFLSRTRPRLVVLMENELWPVLLCSCAMRGIPVVLANARMSDRSFARYRHTGAITAPLFRSLALVLPQNASYAARLSHLGVPRSRMRVCGSMKSDSVVVADEGAVMALATRLGLAASREPIALFASTSQGEEERLLRATRHWGPAWRIIICPRHPERGAEIAALCAQLDLESRRSSAPGRDLATPAGTVVIVDEIGCLGALYGLSAQRDGLAVVGGSLGSGRGGQNMLEAAAAGCAVVVGWDTRNQPDAMRLLRGHQAVCELGESALGAQLEGLRTDPGERARLGQRARHAFTRERGATATVAGLIAQLA